jgi:glutaminyl-tRNA synthetase
MHSEPALAMLSRATLPFVRHGYFIADAVDSNRERPCSTGSSGFAKPTRRGVTGWRKPRRRRLEARAPERGTEARRAFARRRGAGGAAKARAGDPSLAAALRRLHPDDGASPRWRRAGGRPGRADFFESAAKGHPNPRAIANWIANDVLRELKGRSIAELPFNGAALADLVRRIDAGEITTAAARTVFGEMMSGGGAPEAVIRRLGLDRAVGGADLSAAVDAVLASMPDKVESYRAGRTALLGFSRGGDEDTGGKAGSEGRQGQIRRKLG